MVDWECFSQENPERFIYPYKQDRQCTCNVKLMYFRATIVTVESNEYYTFWVCVCSVRYPACSAHVPYYIVIGLFGSTIFFHIS